MAGRTPDQPSGSTTVSGRAMHLFLAGVIALAFVGLFVGIRQGTPAPSPGQRPPDRAATSADDSDAIPAMAYLDFDRRAVGPNREWRSVLSDLDQPDEDMFAYPHRTEAGRRAVLAARAERRAFDGAPPVVPHPIDQMSSTSCMACHGEGLRIGELRASKMSHQYMPNCTQCHVEQRSPDLPDLETARNTFAGFEAPLGGERAWHGAPPTIPHTTFMRENCMACHGQTGPEPIRTTHPWQTNCLQCHAPSAVLDQGVYQFPE